MKTEVNSIKIPHEYVDLCSQWHDGVDTMLYAISSTGGLTLGRFRPEDDNAEPMTNEAWYVSLFDQLDSELSNCVRILAKHPRLADDEDRIALEAFQQWAEEAADRLRGEYELDD